MIDGYFLVNQRKKAGTPILKNQTKIQSLIKLEQVRMYSESEIRTS